jgi:hypothetical protein
MRLEKLRQVDLNLLIIFVCADCRGEKKRHQSFRSTNALSTGGQPRPSARAFHVQDELVIRSSSGFELTLRGRKILRELEQLLPKIEGLVVPSVFDPQRKRSNFRISSPDNVCMALLPHLCRRYTTERPCSGRNTAAGSGIPGPLKLGRAAPTFINIGEKIGRRFVEKTTHGFRRTLTIDIQPPPL